MASRYLLVCLFSLMMLSSTSAQGPDVPKPVVPQDPSQFRRMRPDGFKDPRRNFRRETRGVNRRLVEELNLTAEQQQQQRAILQRRLAATKPQREQLFQLREKRFVGSFNDEDRLKARALRDEIRGSMSGLRVETLSTLTADQRSKLETLRQERRRRRQELLRQRRPGAPTPIDN